MCNWKWNGEGTVSDVPGMGRPGELGWESPYEAAELAMSESDDG
jgi:hypothetical protein